MIKLIETNNNKFLEYGELSNILNDCCTSVIMQENYTTIYFLGDEDNNKLKEIIIIKYVAQDKIDHSRIYVWQNISVDTDGMHGHY